MSQLRNLLKLTGAFLANQTIGNQGLTETELDKLFDDQLYLNTNSKSIYVDTAKVNLSNPTAYDAGDHVSYQALGSGELAAMVDDDVDNAAYILRTDQNEGTGFELNFDPPAEATAINMHVRQPAWTDSVRAANKTLFDPAAPSGASAQEAQAAELFKSTPQDWWPENLTTGQVADESVWKDAGRSVALNGVEMRMQWCLGIRVCYWTGGASPTNEQLDGDVGWTDVPLRNTIKFSTSDYYHITGKSFANMNHVFMFNKTIRSRYWKYYFRFYNQELNHELDPYFRMFRWGTDRTPDTVNDSAGNTIMWPDASMQLPSGGYRLRSIITEASTWDNYNTTLNTKFKVGRLTGTYDWYIEDWGTVNITNVAYGIYNGALKRFTLPVRFIPRDAYQWYLGYYFASGTMSNISLNIGTRHVKSGDLTGSNLAFTPQSYIPLIKMVCLPPLCVNSIRGISAAGLTVAYRDLDSVWSEAPAEMHPKEIVSVDYPIEALPTDSMGFYTVGCMEASIMWNNIGLGPSATNIGKKISQSQSGYRSFHSINYINNKLYVWAGVKDSIATALYRKLTNDTSGLSDQSRRIVVRGCDIINAGNRCKFTFVAQNGTSLRVDNVSIVERDGYTANGTHSPVEILFGGVSGFTISAQSKITSDWLYYRIRKDKQYLVIVDVSTGTYASRYVYAAGQGSYYKASTNSWNQQSVTGFTYALNNNDGVCLLDSIDVDASEDMINTLDVLDFNKDLWSSGIAGGTARKGHTALTYGTKIIRWGGCSGTLSISYPEPVLDWYNDLSYEVSMADYTVRTVIPGSDFPRVGTKIRFIFKAPASQQLKIDNVGFGERSGSTGNTVDTPVAITFGGNANITIPAGQIGTSDWLTLTTDRNKDYLLCVDYGSAISYSAYYDWGGTRYYKAATNSWNVTDISALSFTSDSARNCISKIEIDGYAPAINTTDILETNGQVWSVGTTGGTARSYHAGVVSGNKAIYWGGIDINGNVLNTVDIQNLDTGIWTTGTAGGTARYGHSAVLYDGKIYFYSGCNGTVGGSLLNTIDIYTIAIDSWTTGTAGGTARIYHNAYVLDGKMYVVGGDTNVINIYDLVATTWSTSNKTLSIPNAKCNLIDSSRLIISGSGNASLNTDYIYTDTKQYSMRGIASEAMSKTEVSKVGMMELDFEVAMADPWGNNFLNIGIHAFNNTDPSRDDQGYRNKSGIYFRLGADRQMVVSYATASAETNLISNRHQETSYRRIDSLANADTQYYTRIRFRVNFDNKTFSIKMNDSIIYEGSYTNDVDTAFGAQVGWSIGICGNYWVFDGDGANNDNVHPLTPRLTSNILPTGWVASATSEESSVLAAYKAFNRSVANSDDAWSSGNVNFIRGPRRPGYHALMIKFPSTYYVNKYAIRTRNVGSDVRGCPSGWRLQFVADGISSPSVNNDSDWVDVDVRNHQLDPGTALFGLWNTFKISSGTNAVRIRIHDSFSNYNYYTCIGDLFLVATYPPYLTKSLNKDNATTLLKNIKTKWTGANGEDWLAKSEIITETRIDSTDYSIKVNNARITECLPVYRESQRGLGESLIADAVHQVWKGKTPQDILDVVKTDDLDNYIRPAHPAQDFYIAASLDQIELISGMYMECLEEKHLPGRFEMWLYGAESTDIYWSDSRNWVGIQTRFGNDFAGQWGYITRWGHLDQSLYHGSFLDGYDLIDKQFAWPFYKFNTTWNFLTQGTDGPHGWIYKNIGGSTAYNVAMNYNSTGCMVVDTNRYDANYQRPAGVYFQRTKPDFASGERFSFGIKANHRTNDASGGNALMFYDYNNDYRNCAITLGRGTAYLNSYSNANPSCNRAAGDGTNTGYGINASNNMCGSWLNTDGSVVVGGWNNIALRWLAASNLELWMPYDGQGKWAYLLNSWNTYNILPFFSSTIWVGIGGWNYIDYISSFTIYEGWEIPSAWPLTEFQQYNAIKSIGIAGNWGNGKSFTTQFSDISEDSYYLWVYVAGIQASGDTEVGNFNISGSPTQYTINTVSPYDGAWVQIGSGAFSLSSATTITFTPTDTYGKNSWTKTTAIKGICAKKTTGAPSSDWVPRGYLGTSERCRAAYNNPEIAKASYTDIINQKIAATNRSGSSPHLIKIKPNSPKYSKLIEVALVQDYESKCEEVTHTFNYYYDWMFKHTVGVPSNGMVLESEDNYVMSCYSNPSIGLHINAYASEAVNGLCSGLFSMPFKFGPGFYVETKLTASTSVYGTPIGALIVKKANNRHWSGGIRRAGINQAYNSKFGGAYLCTSNGGRVVTGPDLSLDTWGFPIYMRWSYDGINPKNGWKFACWADSVAYGGVLGAPIIVDDLPDTSSTEDISDSTNYIQIGLSSSTTFKPTTYDRYEYIKVYPGIGGHVPPGFGNNSICADFVLHGFVPVKAEFVDGIDMARISQYADSLWFDSTTEVSIVAKEVEVEYTGVPTLAIDFDAASDYYINSVSYYTDDANAINNVTIDVGEVFDSTAMTRLTLSQVTEGVQGSGVANAKCFRVTHSLGRYDTVVVHARQMIVDFKHDKVDWGITGGDTSVNLNVAPMGDYSYPLQAYIYNPDAILSRDAEISIPNNRFGQYVQISTDGVTWVSAGSSINVNSISPQSSKYFYIRTNVPDGAGSIGTSISRLIFARWL